MDGRGMIKSKPIKEFPFLSLRAMDFVNNSRFFHEFERELENPNFVQRLAQEMYANFFSSATTVKPSAEKRIGTKSAERYKIKTFRRTYSNLKVEKLWIDDPPDEYDRDHLLDTLIEDITPQYPFASSYFHGFYNWAREQKDLKLSKLKALEIAKGCHVKMLIIKRDSSHNQTPFFSDFAFFQAINQHCKLGYPPQKLRDDLWNHHRLKFKPGQKPSSPIRSSKITNDYKRILDIFSPAFDKTTKLSNKNGVFLEKKVKEVNKRIAGKAMIDETKAQDKFFTCRNAKRFAIILTAALHNKSISTIERAIKLG
jgi:hypothetical protein